MSRSQVATLTMQWSCSVCTLQNSVVNLTCNACGTKRHCIPEIEAILVVQGRGTSTRKPVELTKKPISSKIISISGSEPGNVSRKVLQELENALARKTKPIYPDSIKLPITSQVSTKSQKGENIGIGIEKLTLVDKKCDTRKEKNEIHKNDDKKERNFWSCKSCTLTNNLGAGICMACEQPKGGSKQADHILSLSQRQAINRRKSNDPRGPVKSGVKETYDDIISTCVTLKEEFVDDSFLAGPKALFVDGHGPGIVEGHPAKITLPHSWLRPSEINCEEIQFPAIKIKWSIMCDPTPSDIYQGDCWLIQSLAMITERKELLDNIIRTKEINDAGAYIIRLNHFGKWKDVIVDDLLPCDKYRRLIYARGKRKQLWVPLIEKAMAKLNGSYEALIGGSNAESLTTLTGFPCHTIYLDSATFDLDLTWATLVSSVAAGFLIGTGTYCRNPVKMQWNEKMGLKSKHAYSVLEVNDEWGQKLIKLRNPWGKGSWNGDWSPNSHLWTLEMKKSLKLNAREQGTFWMCFEDFVKHFEVLDICRIRQNWKYNSFQGIFVPFADAVSHPCYSIQVEKPTELDITLFQSSWLRRRKNSQSIVPDVALVLLKSNSSSIDEGATNWTLVKYTARVKERDVNLDLMVDPGVYRLVPVSFGHFTNDGKAETFPEFEISIHSSKSIYCNQIRPHKYLLADLIIKVGLDCCDILKTNDPNVILYHNRQRQPFGRGSLYIVENKHRNRSVVVEIDHETSGNVIGTRNLKTTDCISPNSRQIVNILTVKDNQLSYNLHFVLQIFVFSMGNAREEQSLRKRYPVTHIPELTLSNYGLHSPRPI